MEDLSITKVDLNTPKLPDSLSYLDALAASIYGRLPKDEADEFRSTIIQYVVEKRATEELGLMLVLPKFIHWLLVDEERGVINFAINKAVIKGVADLYARQISGENVGKIEWFGAKAAAVESAKAAYEAADEAINPTEKDKISNPLAASDLYASAAAYDAAGADRATYAAYAAATAYAYTITVAADIEAKKSAERRQADKLLQLVRDA